MGLLRRPTPGENVEGGRLGRTYGPGAHSRAIQKTRMRLRRVSGIHADECVTYGPDGSHVGMSIAK
jgi:hypothetical protein